MFSKKESPKYQRMIENELEVQISVLKNHAMNPAEYARQLTTVERLYGLSDKTPDDSVKKETLLNAGANLLGIFMIIKHEHVNVISSKAMSFVRRLG